MKTLFASILLAWSVCSGLAQLPDSPDGTTNQLSVRLWLPRTNKLQAPATINMQAYVRWDKPGLKAGDSVNVKFFANGKSIGSARATWHDTIRPHAAPGQAVPMWILPAGFSPAGNTLKDVPAGYYELTAQVRGANGLSAVSPAVAITVTSP